MTRKRETAAERDERIVREAGPWFANYRSCRIYAENIQIRFDPVEALVRIANRIARRKGAKR